MFPAPAPTPTVTVERRGMRTIGLLSMILIVQFFIYLSVIDQSVILPGNWPTDWQPRATGMLFYIFLFVGMMVLNIAIPRKIGSRAAGTVASFLIPFAAGGFGVWFLTTLAVTFDPSFFVSSLPPPNTGAKFASLTFTILFVAPTEELMFRVVLPGLAVYKGKSYWWVPSIIGFMAFHIPYYANASVGLPPVVFVGHLVIVGALGGLLYLIYQRFGFGAAVGFHGGFDLAANNVIGSLAFG